MKTENASKVDGLADWHVGADGIPLKQGEIVTEEDGELIILRADGSIGFFV